MTEKKLYDIKNHVRLKLVTKSDLRFLYKLLREREPMVSISHKKMPTYRKHVRFVASKPYSKWYIMYYKSRKVGSIYLSKQNEIGIYIVKDFEGDQFMQVALDLLIERNLRNRYIANCNPRNTNLIKFFKRNRFKLVQYSYELIT